MNLSSLFLLSLFSLFLSCSSYKPKFCVNCKYYIQDQVLGSQGIYGRCLKFPRINQNQMDYLVSGERKKDSTLYHYCNTARKEEDMCGKEGKEYRRKLSKREVMDKLELELEEEENQEDGQNRKWDFL